MTLGVKSLSPWQSRAARALLDWPRNYAARQVGTSTAALRAFEENEDDTADDVILEQLLKTAYSIAGVSAVYDNFRRPVAVRLDRPGDGFNPVLCRAGRAVLGWSVVELAKTVNVSRSVIGWYERKGVQLSPEAKEAMVAAFAARGVRFHSTSGGQTVRLGRSQAELDHSRQNRDRKTMAVRAVIATPVPRASRTARVVPVITPIQSRVGRALMGWTIKDLAGRCGISPVTLSKFETGLKPTLRTADAQRLLQVFGDARIEFWATDGEAGMRWPHEAPLQGG